MRKNKDYFVYLLLTVLIIFAPSCTKSSKSSTPSGTILKVIDVGGQSSVLPGFLPTYIVSDNSGNGAIWVSAIGVILGQGGNVSGYNTSVIKYDLSGNVITYTSVFENSTTFAGGMVLDKDGNLWVTAHLGGVLVEISPAGKIIQRVSINQGTTTINIDSNNSIWACVVPAIGHPTFVEVFSNGTIGSTFTLSNGLYGPFAFDQSGHIWAANQGTGEVLEMDTTGNILGTFYAGPSVPGTMTIGDLKIDNSGNVWVTNFNGGGPMTQTGDTVTRVHPSMPTRTFGMGGQAPYGLAVDHNNNIWITGVLSNSVTKLIISNSLFKALNVFRFDQFQEISSPTGPESITVDKNNDIWFTDQREDGYVIKLAP